MKEVFVERIRKYFVLVVIFFVFIFPTCGHIQIVSDDVEAIDNIELEAIDKNDNSLALGDMIYNYPNVYTHKLSFKDLLWNATQYKFDISILNEKFYAENYRAVKLSSVSIYLGQWKIYELNSNNFNEYAKNVKSESITKKNNLLLISGRERNKVLILQHIRQEMLLKICLIFGAYGVLFIILLKLYNVLFERLPLHKCKELKNKTINIISKLFKTYVKNIFLTILFIWVFNIFIQIVNINIPIQICELFLQGIVIAIVYTYIHTHIGSIKISMLSSLIVGIFVILASLHMTTFLGADEVRAITEQLELQEDTFRHWYMQNAHTNYLIMGSLFFLIPEALTENMNISGYELAKLMHWLCGFVIIQVCVVFVYNKMIQVDVDEKKKSILLIGLYASFLTCPILIRSMQYYNYDLFSCAFAILALIVGYYGYKSNNMKEMSFAVIAGSLSLQEKIPVIPLMFMICIAWIDVYVARKEGRWKYYFWGSALVIGLQSIIFMFTTWWVVDVLKAGNVYVQGYSILKNIVYLQLKIIGWRSYLLAFLLLWVMQAIGGMCLHKIREEVKKGGNIYNFVVSALIISYEIVGICVSFMRQGSLNEEIYVDYLLIHIRNCVNQYTTIFLVCSIIFLIYNLKAHILDNYEVTILLILSLVMSFLYAIMGEHVQARYSNIYISGFVIIFSIFMLDKIKIGKIKTGKKECGVTLCMIIVTVIELSFSVKVGYTIFYPIWNISIYQNGIDEDCRAHGTLGPIYFEEVTKYCIAENIKLSDVTICESYKARVTNNIWNIPYTYITDSSTNESSYWASEEMLNDKVFYCIDNYSIDDDRIRVANGYLCIKENKPLIEVKYRGVVISKIYQGNQLKLIEEL